MKTNHHLTRLDMKSLLPLLFSLVISLTSFGQNNGVYLYGYMENAPSQPVSVEVLLVDELNYTIGVILDTDPTGNIPTQWVDLPPEFEILWIGAGFIDCTNEYNYQTWDAAEFDNSIDIPLYFNFCTDSLIYGCTDPDAINYNPMAIFDDGNCEYALTCDLNEIAINFQTSNWASEISWNLLADSNVVASGGPYQNGTTISTNYCLSDGCYTFEMYDTFGDGWNGTTFEIVFNGSVLASGTLGQGNFGSVNFGINQDNCGENIYGCTDPLALNYNPIATHNNGTCSYPVENDICEDALPILPGITLVDNTNAIVNVGIWGECWGFGQGEGEQSSVWYSFTTPDYPARIHLEALYDSSNTLTDTQFGIFEECGGEIIYCDGNGGQGLMSALSFECGELAESTTYILMIDGWNGDAGTCLLEYTIDSVCFDPIYGCMDPDALNYNPEATQDDGSCEYQIECDLNTVNIIISTQSWSNEIYWSLFNADSVSVASGNGYSINNSEYLSQWCLEDGCYTFAMYDTFGDGWNGGSFEIILDGETLAFGTLNSGNFGSVDFGINQEGCVQAPPVYGCTDPEALNYNPDATHDDGSCQFELDCELNLVQVLIFTQSWGSEISWSLINADSIQVASGSGYSNNTEYLSQWCLEDGCYTFLMYDAFGDGWNGGEFEIFTTNEVLASGTLNYSNYGFVNFGINQEGCGEVPIVYGCTDPNAINYNPDATINDGSCIYEIECTEVTIDIDGNIDSQAQWLLTSDAGYINSGTYPSSDITITDCLADGCYTIQLATIDTMTQASYTVFANNQIIAYGDFSNYQTGQFSIGAGCDSTNVVYGCTDPEALNYNPEATQDDGSCVYQFECSIDFLVIPDSTGENIIWILPDENILAATSVLWDFGDGTTSTEYFPQHEYSDEGPFTLCVTATFNGADGSSCSITYCTEISGNMVGGSGFGASDTGFSINVINAQGPVGIAEPQIFSNINLWPNPVSDQLNIKYYTSLNSAQTISIMDITGKTIIQENFGAGAGEFTKVINVSRLPAGVYLLRLNADEYVEAKRFIIAK